MNNRPKMTRLVSGGAGISTVLKVPQPLLFQQYSYLPYCTRALGRKKPVHFFVFNSSQPIITMVFFLTNE